VADALSGTPVEAQVTTASAAEDTLRFQATLQTGIDERQSKDGKATERRFKRML